MFDLNEYLKLEQINNDNNDNNENKLLDFIFNINKFIDKDKMEEDITTLKNMLMKVAELYEKKIVFVADKDKVEMFEAIE